MNAIAIRVEDLTKRFGDFTAVDHVTFEVPEGEVFGLLGPNGAGKSTTIRILCTLSRPTSGIVEVGGYDVVNHDDEVRRHIGLVSEKMIMYTDLTARENLKLFGNLYDLPREVLHQRIDELLEFVRMTKWADAPVSTYSTGMKQRINVIRAMLNQPDILFLDEPTLGLDPQSTVDIRELIQRINVERRTTIILTTHEMTEADMLCRRVGIIDHGKIVALDTGPNLKKLVTGTESRAFEFDISNLTPGMVDSVKSLPCVVSLVQEDRTRVRADAVGDDSFDSMLDTLRKNNARIVNARTLEPTLEDVFIHLTGRSAGDSASGAAHESFSRGRGRRLAPPRGR
jgi:ABC-2 type transport system ATP-binding protein